MQKITTFLTFDNQAEAAVGFYTSIFKNSRSPAPAGTARAAPARRAG